MVEESSFLVSKRNISVTRGEMSGYWAGEVSTGSAVPVQKCAIQREELREY